MSRLDSFYSPSLPLLSFRIVHNYPSLCLRRRPNRRQKSDLTSVTQCLLFDSTILHALNYYTAVPCCRISPVKGSGFAEDTLSRYPYNPHRENRTASVFLSLPMQFCLLHAFVAISRWHCRRGF